MVEYRCYGLMGGSSGLGFFGGVVLLTSVLLLIVLIALNGFFAASEIALISLNDNKIKMMADEGNKKAGLLVKLLGEPSRFLATIQIGITLAGFLASAFAADSFAEPIVDALRHVGVPFPASVLKVITVLIITMVLSYFTLVLGELVPKRIAMKLHERIAFAVVKPLVLLSKLTFPFVKLLTLSTNFFVRLVGIDPHAQEDDVTEEEIRMMVDVGEEKGTIHEHEKIMINNIFEFNNKSADDIMTHRIEVVGLPVSASLDEIMELVRVEQYTRIPVYEDSIDDIVGILHVKDLLHLVNGSCDQEFSLRDTMRKPFFVPISKKIDELFVELQKAKTHMAVVIDEHGGTAGIITIEDLVEEIVGDISDEYDEDELELHQIDDRTFEVDGMIALDDLQGPFDMELPIEEYDTFSGLIISLLGRIPEEGELVEVRYKNLIIKVVEATEKRIERAIVHIEEAVSEESEESEE